MYRLDSLILVAALVASSQAQTKHMMRVTALEYRSKDEAQPYRVEGETLPQAESLHYKLQCKNGAADLTVGKKYRVEETSEDGKKNLTIFYPEPLPGKTGEDMIIGVVCTVESVRAK